MIIERYVSLYDTYHVIPGFFNIVHAKNRGAAFGIFSEGESELRTFVLIAISAAVLVFVSILLFRPAKGGLANNTLTTVALALVLGGAVGNLWDRAAYGMVTDFLEFFAGDYVFPAFNVADSAITVGASLLMLDIWIGNRHKRKERV